MKTHNPKQLTKKLKISQKSHSLTFAAKNMVAETVVAPVAFLAICSSNRIRMDLYPQTKQSLDDEYCRTITNVLPRFGKSIFLNLLRIRLNCIYYPTELIFKITNYVPNSHTHKQFLLCLFPKCSTKIPHFRILLMVNKYPET